MKLKEKIQSIFFFTKEAKSEFELELLESNIFTGVILLYFTLAFQMYNILCITIFKTNRIHSFPGKMYLMLYISLFVITLLLLIAVNFFMNNIHKYQIIFKHLIFIYTSIIAVWGTCITLIDLRKDDDITVYSLIVFVICVTVYQKPPIIAIIFLANHAFFLISIVALHLVKPNEIGIYVNSTAIVFAAIIVSFSRYCNKIIDYKKSRIILRQSKRIMVRNEELKSLSITDALSGLYNRRLLDEALFEHWNQCLTNQKILTVIMIDIDNFKNINDKYGHQNGDRCIERVSLIIRQCTEDFPAMLFRYGGEEFAIIITDIKTNRALEISEKIRKDVANVKIPNTSPNKNINITISIGVYSEVPNEKSNHNEYIGMADQALYRAKACGKNIVINYATKDKVI